MTSSTLPLVDPNDAGRRWSARDTAAVGVLLLGTLFIYLRTARYNFVNYDDQGYLYQNPHMMAGLTAASLRWAMTAIVLGNYHPLTEIVQLAITSAFGLRPAPFHVVNALLHTLNAGLLFLFLRRATGRYWPAVFAVALWAWHPLRVESVAWVSELKDVLCGTFTLLTLLAYVRYARGRSAGRYALLALLLVLALLAKPMAVTVPAVLLLLDYWPLGEANRERDGRWWRDRVLEKIPLAVLAGADVAYALRAQIAGGATGSQAAFPPTTRAANGVVSVLTYLRQTAWPTGLAVFYPHPAMLGRPTPPALAVLAAVVLVALTVVAVVAGRRMPYLPVGWFWFLVMLLPVIGVVQIGEQGHADRYTYLPSIGLTVAVVWAVAAIRPVPLARLAGVAGGGVAVAALCVAVVHVRYWRDSDTLFTHAMTVVPDNYAAMSIVADDLRYSGDNDRALPLAARAVALVGDRSAGAHVVYATCLLATDRDADVRPALLEFMRAAKIRGIDAAAWAGMGQAISRQADLYAAQNRPKDAARRVADAATAYRRALQLDPDDAETADRLGYLLAGHGKLPEAIAIWRALLAKFPNDATAHGELGDALHETGDLGGAVEQYRAATTGPMAAAVPRWEAALAYLVATSPASTPADVAQVLPDAQRACEQTHDQDAGPLDAKAAAQARLGLYDAAVETGTRALRLADAAGQKDLATQLSDRLARYRQFQPYVAGGK